MTEIMLGCTMAAAVMVTLLRCMPARRVFGYATPIDIAFSALMVWAFHGTLAGMSGAAVGGLVLAVTLSIGKWLIGTETAKIRRSGRFKVKAKLVKERGAVGRAVQYIIWQHHRATDRTTT